MISRILAPLLATAALIATPLSAQNQDLGEAPPEGGVIETVDEGEGLNVSVSYEGRLDDLGIADIIARGEGERRLKRVPLVAAIAPAITMVFACLRGSGGWINVCFTWTQLLALNK